MLSMRNSLPRAVGLLLLVLCISWETIDGARTAADRAAQIRRTRKPRTTTSTRAPTTTATPTIPPQTLRTPQEIEKAMKKSEIIPDLLQKAPKTAVLVQFEGNSTADLGNHLCIRDLEYWAPLIQWPANESQYYTMLMLNLDMPTRQTPTQREWIMWLIGNIPGAWVMRGDQIIEYEEPDPEKGTGSHRYVVLIYHQKKGKIKFREYSFDLIPKMFVPDCECFNWSAKGRTYHRDTTRNIIHEFRPQECRRQKFQSRFFADDYSLGDPIGINFWESQYEKKKRITPTMNYEDYMGM